MREIKFKYIIKKDKGHIFSRIFSLEEIEKGDVKKWYNDNYIFKRDINRFEYTEFKDRYGNEIYEGDIIEYDHTLVGAGRRSQIYFKKGSFRIDNLEMSICNLSHMKIIGNICENPELKN